MSTDSSLHDQWNETAEKDAVMDTRLVTEASAYSASWLMHDYLGKKNPSNAPTYINCSTQVSERDVVEFLNGASQSDCSKFNRYQSTGVNCNVKYFIDQATQCTVDTVGAECQTVKPAFTFEDVMNSDAKVNFYTSFPNRGAFQVLFDELSADEKHLKMQVGLRRNVRYIDEFFLVMMRLRLGLLMKDLADRFQISTSTCCNIFTRWVHSLSINLSSLIKWPSRQQIDYMMPLSFQRPFPRCRIVVDCTELFTNRSASLVIQTLSYSHYKSGMTWKGLIGITPNGILSFVSDLWLGSVSDQQTTHLSHLLDSFQPGDVIIADKGFDISRFTTARQIELVIPPKRSKLKEMTAAEIIQTRWVAKLRIHVERYMFYLKRFHSLGVVLAETSQPNEI